METESPYVTPGSDLVGREEFVVPKARLIAALGLLLSLGPAIASGIVALHMEQVFETISKTDGADPAVLASEINGALRITAVGWGFGIVGLVLVCVALVRRTNRERWFYWGVFGTVILWCIWFPVGVAIGVGLLLLLWKYRSEFFRYPT